MEGYIPHVFEIKTKGIYTAMCIPLYMYKLCMHMHKRRMYKKLVYSLTLKTIFLLHTIFHYF